MRLKSSDVVTAFRRTVTRSRLWSGLIGARYRLKGSFRRRRLDRDLDDELAFHLAMRQASYTAHGASATEARREAVKRFGNPTALKERMRDMWTFPSLERLRQDIRYAGRSLRKSPGFSVVAIAALALGIGGTTAIFSVVDAIRAQALPYREPGRLVELIGTVQRARIERRGASYPDYLEWRARTTSFEDIAAFDGQRETLGGSDDPERIEVEYVGAPYFSLLDVAPAMGRGFQPGEDTLSKPVSVAVLSDGLWRRRFGSDPDIVGRTIVLTTRTYTVIGVMPPGFNGLSDRAEAWLPFALYAPTSVMTDRGSRGFVALARLKPGVSVAAAGDELETLSRQLEQAYPATNEQRAVEVSPLDVELLGALRPALLTLLAAVAFVLLIACANVANLLLARSETRRRELAVRTALGAGRGRLLRQLITESCVLTTFGAAAGLLLARASVTALVAWSPVAFPSFVTPALDLRVAVFTVGISLVCGILVGLAPGLQAAPADLSRSLKESAKGSAGARARRVRSVLVVAEMTLAVVLLAGAGLTIRSVRNLAALHPGFNPDSILTLHASIPRAPRVPSATSDPNLPPGPPPIVGARALLNRLRAVSGVQAAALGSDLPLDGGMSASLFTAEGQPSVNAQNVPRAYIHRVSPGFFDTLRIPMMAGRTFTDAESAQLSASVIVSASVARRFWPGQDPIGKRLKFSGPASANSWLSIVGVVGEVKYRGLPENPTSDPDIYLPFLDRNQQVAIAVRTGVPPAVLVAPIRAAIRAAGSSIPVYDVATMDELIGRQTSRSRFTMWLMGVFAAVALLLSVVGIYGVMSYLVSQRTREIGIRLALGATTGAILGLIVGQGVRLIAAGIIIGAAASVALQRVISGLLYGVGATDASAGLAVALLAAVALIACCVPAWRATRVDPLSALRHE